MSRDLIFSAKIDGGNEPTGIYTKNQQQTMSLLKFLKGIFLPKKVAETPVTIVKPEDYPPLVNKVQESAKEALEAPVETAPKTAEQPIEATMTPEEAPAPLTEKPTKTVKDIKSKSNKPEPAPKPKPKSRPKPKPKPKDGDAK